MITNLGRGKNLSRRHLVSGYTIAVVLGLYAGTLQGLAQTNNQPEGADQNQIRLGTSQPDDSGQWVPSYDATPVAVADGHICAVNKDHAAVCWGSNKFGQLGTGDKEDKTTPSVVKGLEKGVKAVAVGDDFSCAVTESSTLKCWGSDAKGQLGDGSKDQGTEQLTPVDVIGLPDKVYMVSASNTGVCAVLVNGAVYCWGEGANQQELWTENTQSFVQQPVQIQNLERASLVSVYGTNFCAVELDTKAIEKIEKSPPNPDGKVIIDEYYNRGGIGPVKCWGGVVGADGAMPLGTPTAVSQLPENVEDISVAGDHMCAVTKDFKIKCWGLNNQYQLGVSDTSIGLKSLPDGTAMAAYHAVKVEDIKLDAWQTVSAGGYDEYGYSCAVLAPVVPLDADESELDKDPQKSGIVKCWGNNKNLIVRNDENMIAGGPFKVEGLTYVISIAGSAQRMCAVIGKPDENIGTVKCWGKDIGAIPQKISNLEVAIQ